MTGSRSSTEGTVRYPIYSYPSSSATGSNFPSVTTGSEGVSEVLLCSSVVGSSILFSSVLRSSIASLIRSRRSSISSLARSESRRFHTKRPMHAAISTTPIMIMIIPARSFFLSILYFLTFPRLISSPAMIHRIPAMASTGTGQLSCPV